MLLLRLTSILVLLCACTHKQKIPNLNLVTRTQQHMGTLIEVRVPKSQLSLSEAAFQVFADLDQRLSTYKDTSEISRLNRNEAVHLSSATEDVLELSKAMKKQTRGYFDVRKGKPNGPIDLGGIGKGFAVDTARALLEKAGVEKGLIAASGDIFCFHACELGIRNPFITTQKPLAWGQLKSGGWAITTSGRDWRDHIVTPGSPLKQQHWMSVTLMSKKHSNAELDAWATALFAMPEKMATNYLKHMGDMDHYVIRADKSISKSKTWESRFYQWGMGL